MATPTSSNPVIKPVTLWIRINLLSATVLCFFAGLSLFIATEQTDRFSAWTITPPITAAFIGAAYWGAGVFLTLLSARERDWARARIAVPAALIFCVLGLGSTLFHLDRFHFTSDNFFTQALTYVWLIPYALGPIFAIVVLVYQLRTPGGDPPRQGFLPMWLRVVLVVQGIVFLGVGIALFVAPQLTTTLWPWNLTPLTAQVGGAWLIGLGVGALQVAWENDWGRVFAAAVCYTLFGLLELVVIARYSGSVDWSRPQTWLYILFMLSVLGTGIYTWLGTRRSYSPQSQVQQPAASPMR